MAACSLGAAPGDAGGGAHVVRVVSADDLARRLEGPVHDTTLLIADIVLESGVVVRGTRVRIAGDEESPATLRAGAGPVIVFRNCEDCVIENLSVAGDGAAVVVENSRVTIRDCGVSGDAGVRAGTGADVTIERCEISAGGDGVALHHDARATLRATIVDGGTDRMPAPSVTGGTAVIATGEARVTLERTWVRRGARGIGIFDDAGIDASGIVVEAMTDWGIAIRGGEHGRPVVDVERTVVYDCGGCAVAIDRRAPVEPGEAPGRLSGVLIVGSGYAPTVGADSTCGACPLSMDDAPEGFVLRRITYYDNRVAPEGGCPANTSRQMFWRARRGWTRTFRNTAVGVDGRHRFHECAFLTRYPRWWD